MIRPQSNTHTYTDATNPTMQTTTDDKYHILHTGLKTQGMQKYALNRTVTDEEQG